jgi:hypothetical protein
LIRKESLATGEAMPLDLIPFKRRKFSISVAFAAWTEFNLCSIPVKVHFYEELFRKSVWHKWH